MNFENIAMAEGQRIAQNIGLDLDQVHPSELLLFAALDANENTYELPLNHDEAIKVLNTAIGLRDRDGFLAVGMAIGVAKATVDSGTVYPGSMQIAYHADDNLFAAAADAAGVLTEAQQVNSIYAAGNYSLRTNQQIRIDRVPNLKFLTTSTTQHSATTVNETTDVIKPLGAVVRFGGGDGNSVIVSHKCLDKLVIEGTSAGKNYLVIRLVGALLKGASTKMYLN